MALAVGHGDGTQGNNRIGYGGQYVEDLQRGVFGLGILRPESIGFMSTRCCYGHTYPRSLLAKKNDPTDGATYSWENGITWNPLDLAAGAARDVFPYPESVFKVTTQDRSEVWALEVSLPYDGSIMEVLDVVIPVDRFAPINERPIIYFTDDTVANVVNVKVIGSHKSINRLALVFNVLQPYGPGTSYSKVVWQYHESTSPYYPPTNVLAYDIDGYSVSGADVSAIGML